MVVNSNNRSPSPMSMRNNPNSNHNLRINQERELLCARKSFSLANKSSINGPNAPPNTPTEFVRRCSFGKEGGNSLQDHEKENERDLNSKPVARVRSPSVPKMTKNFMSPTISAVSKINPSPRKKVLGERNEAIRTSASLSEGKFHFYSKGGSLDFSDENEPKEDMVTPQSSTISHLNKLDEQLNKELEKYFTNNSVGVEKIELGNDLVVLDHDVPMNDAKSETMPQKCDMSSVVFENNVGFNAEVTTCSSWSTTIAPLDLVVLSHEVPMKDAKSETMPQKCDMSSVVNENNVGLNAEVSTCSSRSTTIAPLDADPSLPPYDPNTNFLSPRPQFLHYKPNPRIGSYINQGVRLEDDFSSESFSESEISEEVQSEETSSVETSLEEKSSFVEPRSPESQQLEESVEHEIEPKPWFSGMCKAVCVISFLVLLGFPAVYQGNLAEEKINGLLTTMGFKVREVKFSPLPFDNLTAWKDTEVDNCLFRDSMLRLDKYELRPSSSGEEIELKGLKNYEESDQLIEEFESEELEEDNVVEDYVIEDDEFVVEMIEEETVFTEVENQEAEYVVTSEVRDEFQYDLSDEDQSVSSLPQASEVHPQGTSENDPNNEVQGEFQPDFKAKDQSLSSLPKAPEEPQVTTANDLLTEVSESLDSNLEAKDKRSLASSIAAVFLIVSSLFAATTFMFVKKSRKAEKEQSTRFPATSKIEPMVHENQASMSDPIEVDMMGESFSSEISSFQDKSYNLKDSHKGQSIEKSSSRRNHKRESLASSSSEYTMSASYGSYTTYSKLQSKQRDDGEVVTPVRRSSRIRSKVTSP